MCVLCYTTFTWKTNVYFEDENALACCVRLWRFTTTCRVNCVCREVTAAVWEWPKQSHEVFGAAPSLLIYWFHQATARHHITHFPPAIGGCQSLGLCDWGCGSVWFPLMTVFTGLLLTVLFVLGLVVNDLKVVLLVCLWPAVIDICLPY